jgi:uncharacterized protein YkwD
VLYDRPRLWGPNVEGGGKLKAKLTLLTLVAILLFAVPTTASAAVSISTYKKNLLHYINRYRSNHGLKRLVIRPRLQLAAQAHSRNMARHRLFSHYSSNGTTWYRRIRSFGYRGRYIGENLVVGSMSARRAVRMWKNSPDHRANLLRAVYDHIGIGVARGSYGGYSALYVTADFGGN